MPESINLTPHRNYPLPAASNKISEDVHRLIAALEAIDGDVMQILLALAGKAALEHSHEIEQVSGLVAALASKAASDHEHRLDDLSDVTGTGNASVGSVLYRTNQGWAPGNPATVLGPHEHTVEQIQGLSEAMAQKLGLNAMAADAAKLGGVPPSSYERVRPGKIDVFAMPSAPAGWLPCNGAVVSRTAYAALFSAIGTRWGAGDGSTTFHLPDFRGEFLRGWDDGRGVDSGRGFASFQDSQNLSHTHSGTANSAGAHAHTGTANAAGGHSHTGSANSAGGHTHTYNAPSLFSRPHMGDNPSPVAISSVTANTSTAGAHTHSLTINAVGDHTHALTIASNGEHGHSLTINAAGGNEARPRNRAVLFCIKY